MSQVIPMPRLVIRPGVSGDREAAAALVETVWRDTYRDHLPPAAWQERDRRFFSELAGDPAERGWIAEFGGQVVGYGRVVSNCIDQIWVSARARRKGVASALLEPMLASIRDRGFQFAQAGCEDFNTAARGFFESSGWEPMHAEPQSLGAGRSCATLVHTIRLR